MEECEAKNSVGRCLVKGLNSTELKERGLIARWKAEEWDEKIEKAHSPKQKEDLLLAKARAVAKNYYKSLAELIVSHNFPVPEGIPLGIYLGNLSDDDTVPIEKAANQASSISPEESEDLSQPSEMENPQGSTETPSS